MDEFHWPPKSQSKEKPSQHLFEDLLKSAVLKNCHAERPVGMMLSGGADSSLIYALWYEETGEPLPAFTIQYTNNLRSKYADPNFCAAIREKDIPYFIIR
jgi:asparagine synthase (glutamine-hydrolysing)